MQKTNYLLPTTYYLLVVLLLLILAGGGYWFFKQDQTELRQEEGLIYFIDRNVPAEHAARLTSDISRMQNEIGNRVGEKKSADDLNRWLNIGNLYYVLGNLREARAATLEALDLNSANYIAWGNLGDILTEMNDLSGARQAYQKAVEFSNTTAYLLKYADFLQTKFPNETDEYEKLLVEAVGARGQKPELISRLADFYMKQEQYEKAVSHYEVLVGLLPDDENVKNDLLEARKKLLEAQYKASQ